VGFLPRGDILVSNFNNAGTAPSGNVQGTGTTISDIQSGVTGDLFTFFTGTYAPPTDGGLTTALGILKRGFVVVGQLPNDGSGNGLSGSLLFIDKMRNVVLKYLNVNGPWDLTIDDGFDHAAIFVSNVLSGTVVRLNVAVTDTSVTVNSATEIAHGY
jgi:hypothetical protein